MTPTGRFPSLKGRKLLRILQRTPLNYRITRQTGSHRKLEAEGRPPIRFAFHDGDDIPGGVVAKVLMEDAGLSRDEAEGLFS